MKARKLFKLHEKITNIDGSPIIDNNGPITKAHMIAQVLIGARTPEDAVRATKLAFRIYDESDEMVVDQSEFDIIKRCVKASDGLINIIRAAIEICIDEAEEVEVEITKPTRVK